MRNAPEKCTLKVPRALGAQKFQRKAFTEKWRFELALEGFHWVKLGKAGEVLPAGRR